MAYNRIQYGFDVCSPVPIDKRLVLTRAEMLELSTSKCTTMPDVYFAICKDGEDKGKLFIYDHDRSEFDPVYGRFKVYKEGADGIVKGVKANLGPNGEVIDLVDPVTQVANIELPFAVNADGLLCCVMED